MRRKQLYALAMAGILAVSAVPANTYASAFTTTVENQTPSAIGDGSGSTATPTPTPTATPTPTPQPSKENNNLKVDGDSTTYTSWKDAVDAIQTKGTIIVNSDATVEETVVIPAGKEVTVIASKDVSIKRGKNLTGDMFKVSKGAKDGEGGKLIIGEKPKAGSEKEATGYTITVDGICQKTEEGSQKNKIVETGTIFNVETNAVLTINNKTILKNNKSKAKGSAINSEGTVRLSDVTIEKNQGTLGAVYSGNVLEVSDSVVISDNSKSDGKTGNVALKMGTVINVTGALEKGSKIKAYVENEEKESTDTDIAFLTLKSDLKLNDVKKYVEHESKLWSINESGKIVSELKCTSDKDTIRTGKTTAKMAIVIGGSVDATLDKIVAHTLHVKDGEQAPEDLSKLEGKDVSSNEFSVSSKNLDEDKAYGYYMQLEDVNGYLGGILKVDIPKYVEPEHRPIISEFSKCSFTVSSTSVTKGKTIEVKTKGDGLDITEPGKGDTRWVPYSWVLTNSTGSDEVASGYIVKDANGNSVEDKNYQTYEDKEYSTKISTNDLSVKSYKVKAVFLEQEYNGEKWVATGNEQAKTAKTVTVKKASTATSTKKTSKPKAKTTSKSAKNAKTGDESPILPMSMLAMGALFAGGYVLVRRRKASDDMDR